MRLDTAKLLKIARNNKGLKVLALLLAVIAWYAIRESTSFETLIRDVRLEILVDEGWAVLDRSVDDVDVLFRGSQGDIRNLDRDQVKVIMDMRGKSQAGSSVVPLMAQDVHSPRGARAIYVDPSEITLSLDRESDKQVPVKADILGSPPEGYEVEKVVCTPATILLHGPQGRLESIDVIRTVPIDLEGRLRSFELNRMIMSPGETWSARVEPDRVRVEVTIVERSSRKDVRDVKLRALLTANVRRSVKFYPLTVSVTLEGRSELIDKLEGQELVAYVDCSALKPGDRIDLPVRVQVPTGIGIAKVDPSIVKAEMEGP